MNVDLVLRNARLVTCAPGVGLGALGTIDRGAVAITGGRIAWVGAEDDRPRRATREIDLGGRLLMPGLVDPHTHLVFAGSRIDEFSRKMAGEDYRAIAASGGGIASTVRATRVASDDALFEAARARALEMRASGTTTIEVKSGYGLTVEHELRLLEIGRRLHAQGVANTTTTLLGAHAVPPERKDDRAGYVAEVATVMIPRAADHGLADACAFWLGSCYRRSKPHAKPRVACSAQTTFASLDWRPITTSAFRKARIATGGRCGSPSAPYPDSRVCPTVLGYPERPRTDSLRGFGGAE